MSEKRALIIDDNAKNVNVLVRLLQGQGVGSTQLADPRKLDDTLQGMAAVDVIFLDLEMPMIDGFQVLDTLKADVRFQSVPVVAYTVHVSEINAAHQHGFDGFIGKPLDSDKFPDQLARILSGEAVWEAF